MYKICFNETRTGDGYAFEAGKTYELSHPSCHRWIRRGVAKYVGDKPPDFDPSPKRAPVTDGPKSRICFSEDRSGVDYSFKAGHEYTLPLASCKRWVRRGVATYVGKGPLEAAVVPHEPKQPVPDMVTEDEAPKPKAVKRAEQ